MMDSNKKKKDTSYFALRIVLDKIIAGIGIIVLLPVFVFLSIAIVIDSKGPAIIKQKRYGKDFIPYDMYKFRTMIVNAQSLGTGVYSFADDPRVTRIGRFLRRTSLDEIPQLFNIIKGEMAFVGPRPPLVGYFPQYAELRDAYKKRFEVLPGITGLAQVAGRNELDWDDKVKYDNIYIEKVRKYGIFFDIKIWILTFFRVFSMKGVDEKTENMTNNEKIFNSNGDGQNNEI